MNNPPKTEKKKRLISIVLPVYNEAASLPELFDRLRVTLAQLPMEAEIIAVDDGSRDNSFIVLSELARKDAHLRVIRLKTNFGQTAALGAGIAQAQGDTIVTIDSDLENDPHDMIALIAKLDEGYTAVSGWRQGRWQGSFLSRQLPSRAANWLISRLTGVPLNDYGCTLKVYRAEAIKDLNLYGQMHRFIPAHLVWQGGTLAELPVSHTPRKHGTSNYGFGRSFRVLLDLVFLVFMRRYMNRPMHFFGGWGFVSFLLGVFTGAAAILLRLFGVAHFVETPLPIFSALFIIVGIQFILFGVIAEILMRTYYESQGRRPWVVREGVNL